MEFIFEFIALLFTEFFRLGAVLFGGLISLIPGWVYILFIIIFALSFAINLSSGLNKRKKKK